jgi:hypothetical protein
MGAAERLLHEPQLTASHVRLGQASWELAFEEGQAMAFEAAVEYAFPKQIPVTPASPAPDQSSDVKQSSTLNARDVRWRLW